jgi:hypothetical protein
MWQDKATIAAAAAPPSLGSRCARCRPCSAARRRVPSSSIWRARCKASALPCSSQYRPAILSHAFRGPDRARAFGFWGTVIGVAVALELDERDVSQLRATELRGGTVAIIDADVEL